MKKLLTLALAFVALAVFSSLDVAQQNQQKSTPTGVETKQPATRNKKATPKLTKVKILGINESAKTITVMAKDTKFTFDAQDLKSLPKPGEMIDVWGDPPVQRMICHSCYCPPPGAAGPCNLCCFDYQILRMTGNVTGVDDGAKTFTVMANDKVVTFHGSKLKGLPKVGDIIDITYTRTTGGPMEATTMFLCSSECVRRPPGGCICP
jgi:hypothetical protein